MTFKYDIVTLLELFETRPFLWDKSSDAFIDKVVKQRAWNEIFRFLEERYDELTTDEKKQVGRESEIEDFIISVGMNSDSEDESDDYEDQDCESDQSMEDYNQLMEGIEPIMSSDDQDTAGPSGL
ncbi:unnamed protein product [Parnassius apollo]|uniref:(apollo) hypothetical protein n=1 Tax=Parnassius apollo TaxID=110799 RepID=A0A8S3X3I2_PARAO|nr:unnamed protein product [Parnassius apollo]